MARKRKREQVDSLEALVQALLITELGRAGVGQAAIREVAGCDMNLVNRIVKPIKRERRRIEKARAAVVAGVEEKLALLARQNSERG